MSIMNPRAVYFRDMIPGKRYSWNGEVQIDPKTGKVFHKRLDGTIAEIKPHESSLFYKIEGVDYDN